LSAANKAAISEFLSSVHIGGVRDSDRPMVIVDGQSYLAGDVLMDETGLTFAGVDEGKLVFHDDLGIVYLKSF
jgi:hypothetical protein